VPAVQEGGHPWRRELPVGGDGAAELELELVRVVDARIEALEREDEGEAEEEPEHRTDRDGGRGGGAGDRHHARVADGSDGVPGKRRDRGGGGTGGGERQQLVRVDEADAQDGGPVVVRDHQVALDVLGAAADGRADGPQDRAVDRDEGSVRSREGDGLLGVAGGAVVLAGRDHETASAVASVTWPRAMTDDRAATRTMQSTMSHP
jgi:hypothetical protein